MLYLVLIRCIRENSIKHFYPAIRYESDIKILSVLDKKLKNHEEHKTINLVNIILTYNY